MTSKQQHALSGSSGSKKRKDAPANQQNSRTDNSHKRHKPDHRAKQRESRVLAAQSSFKAFKNGELDVDKFVKAREYEIRALEEGISQSKKALTKRAFQQVPKDLRRRTASHNVKKVPKRLQARARREMAEDKTPTVTARARKPTRHMRLRLNTSKALRALGAHSKREKEPAQAKERKVATDAAITSITTPKVNQESTTIVTRAPRVKKVKLATAPVVKAKFRKRQINKTWLPTHMFHAKRARMSPPADPLWRFAVPMTPTAKCYRPTHRAANERGAVAWDMSYMSTIGLEGQQNSIEVILKAVGVGSRTGSESLWAKRGQKWRNGTRVWEGIVYEREKPQKAIAPVAVIWSALHKEMKFTSSEEAGKQKRKAFLRIHPSAFAQLWEEMTRLCKVAKPQVSIEDLRYQLGSIEITGPGSTEALLGALWPSPSTTLCVEHVKGSVEGTWQELAGLTNPAGLPAGALLAFDIQDPRLHHPPRTIQLPNTAADHQRLLELTTTWPVDYTQTTPSIFDKRLRLSAASKLQSQKAINRRKALATPGQFPEPTASDPRIPCLLYCTSTANGKQNKWTVLLPWKCVQPVWYSVMYYPLSTGGQPRFGGIEEKRQLSFETGTPSFPEDFPGTQAGFQWEMQERRKRHTEWNRRPKSKRVNWDVVDLGGGRRGEIGEGSACDWQRLINGVMVDPQEAAAVVIDAEMSANCPGGKDHKQDATCEPFEGLRATHCSVVEANTFLSTAVPSDSMADAGYLLANVRITFLNRGVPQACARIYRLPSSNSQNMHQRWMALHPNNRAEGKHRGLQNSFLSQPKNASVEVAQKRLAEALMTTPKAGDNDYPICPDEDDLIGFVTSGNFNLGEGQGTGIGAVLLNRVEKNGAESRLCIVRNAGNGVGRLARWDLV